MALQPLSHSVTQSGWVAEWLRQPLCQSGLVAQWLLQPICRSHSATQPLSHSRPATQPLCQRGWTSHSATQPLCQSGWVAGPASLAEWLSGWVAASISRAVLHIPLADNSSCAEMHEPEGRGKAMLPTSDILSIPCHFRPYSVCCGVERWRTRAKVLWPPVLTCDRRMVPIMEHEFINSALSSSCVLPVFFSWGFSTLFKKHYFPKI